MDNNKLDDPVPCVLPSGDASDYELLKEINRVAAGLSCFDTLAPGSIKEVEFMPSFVDGTWIPDTTHLDTDKLDRKRMIANHPLRFFRRRRAIELEADARIALQRAAMALERGDRKRAVELLKKARNLVAQANEAEHAVIPALEVRQRAGGKATAAKQLTRKAAIDQYVADAISEMPLASEQLAAHPKIAEALKGRLAHFLYDQRNSLKLTSAVLDKVRMETHIVGGKRVSVPSPDGEKYAYGQILQLLTKPKAGRAPSRALQALIEKKSASHAMDASARTTSQSVGELD